MIPTMPYVVTHIKPAKGGHDHVPDLVISRRAYATLEDTRAALRDTPAFIYGGELPEQGGTIHVPDGTAWTAQRWSDGRMQGWLHEHAFLALTKPEADHPQWFATIYNAVYAVA